MYVLATVSKIPLTVDALFNFSALYSVSLNCQFPCPYPAVSDITVLWSTLNSDNGMYKSETEIVRRKHRVTHFKTLMQ